MLIRQEEEKDYKEIYKVNEQAFKKGNEAKLVDLLRQGKSFVPELSLVAETDGKIIGHILFSKIEIVKGQSFREGLALAPMAVLPQFQNQGVGSQLVRNGIERAKQLGFPFIVVLGHKDYYPKFGFFPASHYDITTEYDVPDFTFALELKEGGLNGTSGRVRYPVEFSVI